MGKYSQYRRSSEGQPFKIPIHPVWRGIGFALMILIPILSYIGSILLLEQNNTSHWFAIPYDLLVRWRDPFIIIKLLITIVFVFLAYSLFMLITFSLFRIFAPPRYGPFDVPPGEVKFRRDTYRKTRFY